jgi:uncharacterized oligopeptide transporter (OPT) family protein
MVLPMLVGVSLAMLLDAWLLYRMFDTPAFPARNPWPLGIAAAEAIKAGDSGGKQAKLLLGGLATGVAGAVFALPVSAFGVALIGGLGAMIAFGIGLLLRAYSMPLLGGDIAKLYIPHGMMIGAGLVALVQVALLVMKHNGKAATGSTGTGAADKADDAEGAARLGRSLRLGTVGYLAITLLLTVGTGIDTGMSFGMLVALGVYGTFAAFVHELIVGIAGHAPGLVPGLRRGAHHPADRRRGGSRLRDGRTAPTDDRRDDRLRGRHRGGAGLLPHLLRQQADRAHQCRLRGGHQGRHLDGDGQESGAVGHSGCAAADPGRAAPATGRALCTPAC